MTPERHQLIEDYLRRLDNASALLSADRRAELRQEIVEHIDAGLEEAEGAYTAAVRSVLERLGPPADIVAAELGPSRSSGSLPIVRPTAHPAVPPAPAAAPLAVEARTVNELTTGEHGSAVSPLVPVDPEAPAGGARGRRRKAVLLVVGGVGVILACGLAVVASDVTFSVSEEPPSRGENESVPTPYEDPDLTYPMPTPQDTEMPTLIPEETPTVEPDS